MFCKLVKETLTMFLFVLIIKCVRGIVFVRVFDILVFGLTPPELKSNMYRSRGVYAVMQPPMRFKHFFISAKIRNIEVKEESLSSFK